MTTAPVREGLFTAGELPALCGSRCRSCGAHHFPVHDTCPYCAVEDPEPVALAGRGTLWAWTAVTAAPPGYRGEIPYGVGVVELTEGIRVIGRLTEADPTRLVPGQPMTLTVVPLHVAEDGTEVVTYAFTPAAVPPAGAGAPGAQGSVLP